MADSKYYSIAGIGSDVELGSGGPRLIVAGSSVELKSNDGTVFVKLKGLAGSSPDDFVTFSQLGTAQPIDVDLSAIAALTGAGLAVRVSEGVWALRTVTNTAGQTVIANGDGSAGNIVVGIANNVRLPGTEGLTFPSGTTAQRAITPLAGEARYNSTNSEYEGFLNSTWLPFGNLLQVVTTDVPQGSVATQIPFDNTVPLSTEGTLIATATITPKLSTSKIFISLGFMTDSSSSNRNNVLTLFDGTTFIGVAAVNIATTGRPRMLSINKMIISGSTATKTITARLGSGTASTTTYINRAAGATFGGTNTTQMIIWETK